MTRLDLLDRFDSVVTRHARPRTVTQAVCKRSVCEGMNRKSSSSSYRSGKKWRGRKPVTPRIATPHLSSLPSPPDPHLPLHSHTSNIQHPPSQPLHHNAHVRRPFHSRQSPSLDQYLPYKVAELVRAQDLEGQVLERREDQKQERVAGRMWEGSRCEGGGWV